jgi:hypothetical protein
MWHTVKQQNLEVYFVTWYFSSVIRVNTVVTRFHKTLHSPLDNGINQAGCGHTTPKTQEKYQEGEKLIL